MENPIFNMCKVTDIHEGLAKGILDDHIYVE